MCEEDGGRGRWLKRKSENREEESNLWGRRKSSIQRGGYTLLVRITTSEFEFREPKINGAKKKVC